MLVVLLGVAVAIAQVVYLRLNPLNPVAGGRNFTAIVALGAGASAIVGCLIQGLLGLNYIVYDNKLHQNVGNNSFTLVYDSSSGAPTLEDRTLRRHTACSRVSNSWTGYLAGRGTLYLDAFVIGVVHGIAIGVLVALARFMRKIRHLLPAFFTSRRFEHTIGESSWSTAKHYFPVLPTRSERHPGNRNVINLDFEITRTKIARTSRANPTLERPTNNLRLKASAAITPKTNTGDTKSSMSQPRDTNNAGPFRANLVDSYLRGTSRDTLEPLSMMPLTVGSPPGEPSVRETRVKLPSALHAEDQETVVPTTEVDDQSKKKRRRSKASQAGRLKRAIEYAKKKEALNTHGSE